MKIIKIVTDPTEIWRFLKHIGWPTTAPDFDEPQDLIEWEICQLTPRTVDGFPEEYDPPHSSGPDPPESHFNDNIDPTLGRVKFHSIRITNHQKCGECGESIDTCLNFQNSKENHWKIIVIIAKKSSIQ